MYDTYPYTHIHIHLQSYTYTHIHTHPRTNTPTLLHTPVYKHIYKHSYTHLHTHTHPHTHTHNASFPSFAFHSSVRNLGVVLDSTLTFSEHVAILTRSSCFHLRRLRAIRRLLSCLYLNCPCLLLLSHRLLQFPSGWSSKGSSFSYSVC